MVGEIELLISYSQVICPKELDGGDDVFATAYCIIRCASVNILSFA
jgi:hypothetical protein